MSGSVLKNNQQPPESFQLPYSQQSGSFPWWAAFQREKKRPTVPSKKLCPVSSPSEKKLFIEPKKETIYIPVSRSLITVNGDQPWENLKKNSGIQFVHPDITASKLKYQQQKGTRYFFPHLCDFGNFPINKVLQEIKEKGLITADPALMWAYIQKKKDWEKQPMIFPMERRLYDQSGELCLLVYSMYRKHDYKELDLYPCIYRCELQPLYVAFEEVFIEEAQ